MRPNIWLNRYTLKQPSTWYTTLNERPIELVRSLFLWFFIYFVFKFNNLFILFVKIVKLYRFLFYWILLHFNNKIFFMGEQTCNKMAIKNCIFVSSSFNNVKQNNNILSMRNLSILNLCIYIYITDFFFNGVSMKYCRYILFYSWWWWSLW